MQQIVSRCWLASWIGMCAAEADAGADEAATAGLVTVWRASSTLQPKDAATGRHTISQRLIARQLGHPATYGSTRCSRHRVKIRASMPCAMGRQTHCSPVRSVGVATTLRICGLSRVAAFTFASGHHRMPGESISARVAVGVRMRAGRVG